MAGAWCRTSSCEEATAFSSRGGAIRPLIKKARALTPSPHTVFPAFNPLGSARRPSPGKKAMAPVDVNMPTPARWPYSRVLNGAEPGLGLWQSVEVVQRTVSPEAQKYFDRILQAGAWALGKRGVKGSISSGKSRGLLSLLRLGMASPVSLVSLPLLARGGTERAAEAADPQGRANCLRRCGSSSE